MIKVFTISTREFYSTSLTGYSNICTVLFFANQS